MYEVIPQSLAKEEDRPQSQLRSTQHRKRRLDDLKDHAKRFKKTMRIKKQNEEWDKLEKEGGIVSEWHRNERKKEPVPKNKAPKKKPVSKNKAVTFLTYTLRVGALKVHVRKVKEKGIAEEESV